MRKIDAVEAEKRMKERLYSFRRVTWSTSYATLTSTMLEILRNNSISFADGMNI